MIRKMRSDLNVHPKIKIDIYCRFEEGLYDHFMENNSKIITSLIKSNGLYINNGSYDITECIAVTVDEMKLYIPIKKIIDIDVEKQRLEKNLANMKNNLKKIESKLDNKSFIEKAPSEIIQADPI